MSSVVQIMKCRLSVFCFLSLFAAAECASWVGTGHLRKKLMGVICAWRERAHRVDMILGDSNGAA